MTLIKHETKMAALSRYIEMKYRDYYDLRDGFLHSLRSIPQISDLIAFESIVEYSGENGIDEYISDIYDEHLEIWLHSIAIRSARDTRRKKKSIWSHYKLYMGIPDEYSDEELISMFSPLAKSINRLVRKYDDLDPLYHYRAIPEMLESFGLGIKLREVRDSGEFYQISIHEIGRISSTTKGGER